MNKQLRQKKPLGSWASHLSEADERRKFLDYIQSCVEIRERLSQMLSVKVETSCMTKNDYEGGSWGYKQAHMNGRNEALKEVISLLTITDLGET